MSCSSPSTNALPLLQCVLHQFLHYKIIKESVYYVAKGNSARSSRHKAYLLYFTYWHALLGYVDSDILMTHAQVSMAEPSCGRG